MKKGLIIGKFMPVHKGHMALVEYAKSHCDLVIVAICSLADEPIDGRLRYAWLQEIYRGDSAVQVEWITERLHDSDLPIGEAAKLWSTYLIERFPDIDSIFSSEPYGDYVAEYMGIRHIVFDPSRERVQISATDIRSNPYRYWELIPEPVQKYFMHKEG